MRFHWGHGIALYFVLFAGTMLAFVFMSTQHDVNLVTEDYYAEEVAYQQRIDRIKNAHSLKESVVFMRSGDKLQVRFPVAETGLGLKGQVQIFRPSDRFKDQQLPLQIDDKGVQEIDLSKLTKGSYTIKIKWEADGRPFYSEYKIFI